MKPHYAPTGPLGPAAKASRTRPAPWLGDFLARLAVVSGVGYLAAAYSVSRWLTRPSRCRPRWNLHSPSPLPERLECRTADGFRLAGWTITPAAPRGTVALFHGLRRSREQILDRMAVLFAAGFRCVAFDHRAHGESAGRKTTFGYRESLDVEAVLALARQRWPGEPVGALGLSMGAAAICFAADTTRSLDAIVLESLYEDIGAAFASRIGATYPDWFRRFSTGVVWVTERRLGVRVSELAPARHVERLSPAPLLLVCGTEDPHASVGQTMRLSQRCRSPREVWLVRGASHLDVFQQAGPAYAQRVVGFLDRHMRRGHSRRSA